MIQLLGFWLVWRAIRMITATAVVIGAVVLLAPPVNGHAGATALGAVGLDQLHRRTHELEQQLKRTVENTVKP
jgi:hypothetical protein